MNLVFVQNSIYILMCASAHGLLNRDKRDAHTLSHLAVESPFLLVVLLLMQIVVVVSRQM